jgi:flagellar hook-associated protein 3 FlgL
LRMRVTANSFTDSLINQLNALTSRQYRLQNQVSSGKRVQAPEDDPSAMQRALNLQAGKALEQQYSDNIATLQLRANETYSVLQAIKSISDRVGEITTLADGTKSQTDLNYYAAEVNELIEQAVQLMNTKDSATGQYLFSGTQSDQAPYTTTTDTEGNITGVTYHGNASVSDLEIGTGVTLALDVPGENSSGTGPRGLISDSRNGADLFNHLISLHTHLVAGDVDAIASNDRTALLTDEDNLLYHVSNSGMVQSRLNTAATFASDRSASLDEMISKETDADLVQTMVQLNETQTAYRAALQSGAQIMQLSLLNYLD